VQPACSSGPAKPVHKGPGGHVGQRPEVTQCGLAAGERQNRLIRSSGKGRGRTADLPLFSRVWGSCGDHRQNADLWGFCGPLETATVSPASLASHHGMPATEARTITYGN
jgi:hypothetical protein